MNRLHQLYLVKVLETSSIYENLSNIHYYQIGRFDENINEIDATLLEELLYSLARNTKYVLLEFPKSPHESIQIDIEKVIQKTPATYREIFDQSKTPVIFYKVEQWDTLNKLLQLLWFYSANDPIQFTIVESLDEFIKKCVAPYYSEMPQEKCYINEYFDSSTRKQCIINHYGIILERGHDGYSLNIYSKRSIDKFLVKTLYRILKKIYNNFNIVATLMFKIQQQEPD